MYLSSYQGESNCCGAGVYENTDICSDCKEHCEIIDEEEAIN